VAGEFNDGSSPPRHAAEQELAESAPGGRTFRYCWMFSGTAGRREAVDLGQPRHRRGFEDLPEAEEQAAEMWLAKVRRRVERAGGLRFPTSAMPASQRSGMATAGQKMARSIRRLDHRPLDNRIYAARPTSTSAPSPGTLS
jgi:hypothetical protein